MMKSRLATLLVLFSTLMFAADSALADSNVKFAFANAELTQIIETYAKASGKKIVVDPELDKPTLKR